MLVIGSLLIIAAGLKIYGIRVSAIPPVGRLSSPTIQLFAVLWELALGSWMISGIARVSAWLTGVMTFFGFAGISGLLGLQGVASCGCFGVIAASPWAAFVVDVAVLTVLGLFRPSFEFAELIRFAKPAFRTATGSLLVLAVAAGVGTLLFGSVTATLAKLRGDTVASPDYLDLGSGAPGDVLNAAADVTNYTDKPIRLIGGTSDCSCITTSAMPLTIEPGATASVVVSLRIPPNANSGTLTRTAEFWTDCPSRRTLKLRLGATVTSPPAD